MRAYTIAQGTLLNDCGGPEWERNPYGRGYMYTHELIHFVVQQKYNIFKAIHQ